MGMKTYLDIYPHVAKIQDSPELVRTYEALDWLDEKGLEADRDYKVDMKGGREGHTDFMFKRSKDAMMFKLSFP